MILQNSEETFRIIGGQPERSAVKCSIQSFQVFCKILEQYLIQSSNKFLKFQVGGGRKYIRFRSFSDFFYYSRFFLIFRVRDGKNIFFRYFFNFLLTFFINA